MDSLALITSNLFSPPVVAFGAGVVSVWLRSDLKFPEQVYQGLTIYLLLAIGFKGGSAMAQYGIGPLALPLFATLIAGSLIPIAVFFATRSFLKDERLQCGRPRRSLRIGLRSDLYGQPRLPRQTRRFLRRLHASNHGSDGDPSHFRRYAHRATFQKRARRCLSGPPSMKSSQGKALCYS